jgi:transposase
MPKTIINEEIYEKARNGLIQLKSKGTAANKLKAIMASYKHGAKKVSEILDVDITSIYKWTIKLDREGYRSLINQAKHQDGIKLKKIHKERIRKWLEKDPNISITDIKEKIKNQFNIDVSKSTIHRAMKDSGFSYITPRKNHYKQDKEKVENFKKKSSKGNKGR